MSEYFSKVEAKEKPNRLVVEIGSGENPSFMKFVQADWLMNEVRNSQYVCVDICESVLKQQKDISDVTLANGIEMSQVVADGRKLPFENNSVDTVLLADVFSYRVFPKPINNSQERLEYIKEEGVSLEQEMGFRQQLIDEIYRVLKVGGKMIVGDYYRLMHPSAYYDSIRLLKKDKRFIEKIESEYNNGRMGEVQILEKKPPR